MRVRFFVWVALMLATFLAGCSQERMMKTFASPEDEQAAKHYISLLQARNFDGIENDLDPEIKSKSTDLHQTLLAMAAQMPAQAPISVKLVGANFLTSNTLHKSKLTYEYHYPDRWLLVSVAVQKKDGVSTIIGFNVNKVADSLENSNKFGLSGKSPLQYAVLAVAVLAPLFSLYALVLCIRTRMQGKKWLWILSILFGIGSLSVNWTTGQLDLQLLSIQLLSASAVAPPYGAWTVSVSVPLGAILFVVLRRRLAARVERAVAPIPG